MALSILQIMGMLMGACLLGSKVSVQRAQVEISSLRYNLWWASELLRLCLHLHSRCLAQFVCPWDTCVVYQLWINPTLQQDSRCACKRHLKSCVRRHSCHHSLRTKMLKWIIQHSLKRSEGSQVLQLHQGWDGCWYRALELIIFEIPKMATLSPWKCEWEAHKANTH